MSDGVQGPFPGVATALVEENERLRAELDSPLQPYVDCVCTGCPRKVPQAWVSGMCSPCVDEDCEHTDGARAVAAERDRLEAEVERLEQRLVNYERAGIDPHKSFCRAPADHMWDCTTATAVAERDELAARCRRLEDESNEARRVAIGAERKRDSIMCWPCAVAYERARLGVADSAAAGVNHDQRDVGAQAQPAGVAAAPTGQAGGAQSGSAGPPGGLGCPKHPEHLCVAMAANMPGRPSGLCVYGCAIDNGHPPPSLKPAYALHVIAGGRELMRVLNGVTPDDLRAQGFPDVAAALERRR